MAFLIKSHGGLNQWINLLDGDAEVATLKKTGFFRVSGIITVGASTYTFKFVWFKRHFEIFDSTGSYIGIFKRNASALRMRLVKGYSIIKDQKFEFSEFVLKPNLICTSNGQQIFEINTSASGPGGFFDHGVTFAVDNEITRLLSLLIIGLFYTN